MNVETSIKTVLTNENSFTVSRIGSALEADKKINLALQSFVIVDALGASRSTAQRRPADVRSDDRFKREAIAPIQNKTGQFLLNPVVRNILGQLRKKVDIPFIMNNGRLFIANLSKGQLGHDKANLLGSLLVTQFQLGAMVRSMRPESERRDFYLFIDEFQNFSTDAFASILAEARKYRLCLTLSHQCIDQLPDTIRQAVFGNVGTGRSPTGAGNGQRNSENINSNHRLD